MQKAVLTVVGLVGVSLLLCGSGVLLARDSPKAITKLGLVELPLSILQVQQEVAQQKQEVARLREELDKRDTPVEPMGVGGSGQAGQAPEDEPALPAK